MRVTREEAARMAAEVVEITRDGAYVSPGGHRVSIREHLAAARSGTTSYPPDRDCPVPEPSDLRTTIEVANTTTLNAARDLSDRGMRPAALNFANANVPGGGFLMGARAQEASLCWASGLFSCLLGDPMYEFHGERPDFLYTDYVIHTPLVPVFRGEDGSLLETPWLCTFLTSPAPFATMHLLEHPEGSADLATAFASRIARVVTIAAAHGHDALVLGAWGCGAFGNDPTTVAERFREALTGPFRNVFSHVVFAITDSSETLDTLGPFSAAFAG